MELPQLHGHLHNTHCSLPCTALRPTPTPASLPLLNARTQIVVWNQREACARSETNKTAAQLWRSG